MTLVAHLTILWGSTPVAHFAVRPGQAVGVGEDGLFRSSTRALATSALVVRMQPRGATVSRPDGARALDFSRNQRSSRKLADGADVQIALAASRGSLVYRQGMEWEAAPLTLRIAVAKETTRAPRKPILAARLAVALSAVAAAHALTLTVSAAVMPRLDPYLDEDFLFSSSSGGFLMPIFADVSETEKPYHDAPGDDRSGEAAAVCMGSPPVGHSAALQGPEDNLDPHLANHRGFDSTRTYPMLGEPSPALGTDDAAPIAPWGRDDALGSDRFSATGTARGDFTRPWTATCFGPPPASWSCPNNADPPEVATPESLGLIGIGEASPPRDPPPPRRRARVVIGPIAVTANVPRWAVASAVRDTIEAARGCYERALVDDAELKGQIDVALKIVGEEISVKLTPRGDLGRSGALLCCVDHAHDGLGTELPPGTRATGRYAITFGRP